MNRDKLIRNMACFVCDILGMDEPQIEYMETIPSVDASYIRESDVIVFAKGKISNYNDELLLVIVAHELRHKYQYEEVRALAANKHVEETYIVQEWKKSFDNYKHANEVSKNVYQNQTVELDAVAFSEVIVQSLNPNRNLDLDSDFRAKVNVVKKILAFQYKDDIKEVLEEYGFNKKK